MPNINSLQEEKEKLLETIRLINDEISLTIEKKKGLSSAILNFREKALEEYKDDEDKVAEYFDHERFVEEETFKLVYRRLKEFVILSRSPYFGRVDFYDEELNEMEKIYIGRFGITPKDALEPLVIDWRAPVCSLFYNGALGKASYMAPEGEIPVDVKHKRQYIIKNKELLGMFDCEIDIKDEVLQMVLSKNSSDKLKDIIMTIQSEQDSIIRKPKNKIVLVDGVAGSGKTTVALHRVAYLLYNYRDTLNGKVLILGPNSIFIEYISRVLPSLGEVGVLQMTFAQFAMDLIGIEEIMDFGTYYEKFFVEDEKFIKDFCHKSSPEYIVQLDNFIQDLNKNYFKYNDVILCNKLIISKEDIRALAENYYADMPLFKRIKKIKRIIFSKLKDVRNDLIRDINNNYKSELDKLSKDQLELNQAQMDMYRRIKIRETIKNVMDLKKSLSWLNSEDCVELYKSYENISLLTYHDLAPILYLKLKLEGLKMKKEIKHIVIDEAQDYSLLMLKVLKEITRCNAFTIVGDRNQRILPSVGASSIDLFNEYFKDGDIETIKLNRSYRSTAQIMDYANGFLKDEEMLPMVREGAEVKKVSLNSMDFSKTIEFVNEEIQRLSSLNYESIAVLCRSDSEAKKIWRALKERRNITLVDNEDMLYKAGILIMPIYYAKGLEFDGVIAIMGNKDEDKLNYVLSTRALHELVAIEP